MSKELAFTFLLDCFIDNNLTRGLVMYEFFEIGNLDNKALEVKNEGIDIIKIPYYFNSFHNSNVYFKIDEVKLLDKVNSELLDKLSSYFGKPIQIMISSERKDATDMLKNLGFERKRVCYEIEVGKEDYSIYEKDDEIKLITAHKGSKEFEACADLMLERYKKTHLDINPWTGKRSDFFNILPEKVVYEKKDDSIENLAFIENEEVAYVFGKNVDLFRKFSSSLILKLFEKYENIYLEADDCDEFAMELKKLSGKDYDVTWDTYIYKK